MFAILSSRHVAFERPLPPDEGDNESGTLLEKTDPYKEEIVPLIDLSEALFPGRNALLKAWESLHSVDTLTSGIAAHLIYVLAETVADPDMYPHSIPGVFGKEAPVPASPTAAHPRAYKGTKHKPPKLPQTGPRNLQPYMCSLSSEENILNELKPFFTDKPTCVEPGVNLPGGQDASQFMSPEYRKRTVSLPKNFIRYLFWNIRYCNADTTAKMLSIYWALGLEENKSLRRCLSMLLSMKSITPATTWCHAITQMPPGRRTSFAELLIESGAYSTIADEEIINGLIRADALSCDAVYRHRMFYALTCVREKYSLNYANDGFLLANNYRENYEFRSVASLSGIAETVHAFTDYVDKTEDWEPYDVMVLWRHCAELDGYHELLKNLNWRSIDPSSAYRLFRIFGNIVYEELNKQTFRSKWSFIRRHADFMLSFIMQIPFQYRKKALYGLGDILWVWDKPSEVGSGWAFFCSLIKRLCAPPFKERAFDNDAFTAFSCLPPFEQDMIEKAPDKSFLKLEDAIVRSNDALLIYRGLWSLCDIYPGIVASGFVHYPQQVCKCAYTLGVLDVPIRREIIKNFTQHPLSDPKVTALSIEDLVSMIDKYVKAGVSNPVPKRLRDFIAGRRSLQTAQVERDKALIRDRWLALQLDVLNQLAFDQLSIGLPAAPRDSKLRHALMMKQLASEHRRSLRRLLKEYLSDHRNYAEQHIKNKEWLRKHPKIDPVKWIQGISCRREVAGHGLCDLAIEGDPLEVLRLGSYFGTCLGVGGSQSYSAAAITLDINKQVVYARNAANRVIARQLLAVSEDDRLICFSVYPEKIDKEIKGLFRDYDMQMAEHLGLDIFLGYIESDHQPYEIASIISRNFWDDYAWDLKILDN